MDEFSNLVRQMNTMVSREMGRKLQGFSPTDAWRPSVNLYETRDSYLICVDLAGMDQTEIEVTVEKGHVVVRGRRMSPMPPDGSRAVAVHLMEIDHGMFCRTIEMPGGVSEEAIAANYHLGMLWVTLPKRA